MKKQVELISLGVFSEITCLLLDESKTPSLVFWRVLAAAFPSTEPVSIKYSIKIPRLISCLIQLAEKWFFFSQQNERRNSFTMGSVKLLAIFQKACSGVVGGLETSCPWSWRKIWCHDGTAYSFVSFHPAFLQLSFPLPRHSRIPLFCFILKWVHCLSTWICHGQCQTYTALTEECSSYSCTIPHLHKIYG